MNYVANEANMISKILPELDVRPWEFRSEETAGVYSIPRATGSGHRITQSMEVSLP